LCGGLVFSGERELFDGSIDTLYADMTEVNKINVRQTGDPMGAAAGAMIYDEVMMTVDCCEKLYEPGQVPAGPSIMDSLRHVGSYTGVMGTATLHPDKFFYFPVHYYLIEEENFQVLSLEEL